MLRVLGRANSINVQKVMWCCGELGLEVDRVDIGGPFGGNDQPEYLAKNPNGLVPTLEDGDFVVWESNNIVRYLVETRGAETGLMPADAKRRALAGQWMDWVHSLMGPMVTVFVGLVRTPEEKRDIAAIEKGQKAWERLMRILDGRLADAPFVAGEELSVGDFAVGPYIYRWLEMPMERPELAHVKAYRDRLGEREPFRTHVMMPLT